MNVAEWKLIGPDILPGRNQRIETSWRGMITEEMERLTKDLSKNNLAGFSIDEFEVAND